MKTPIPDPYAKAHEQAPLVPTPDLDPDYQPKGNAPDGYAIARTIKQVEEEERKK